MADQYLLGWILASVLGLVALYRTLVKRNDDRRSALVEKRSECVKSVMVSNGECRSTDGDVDVIIVGAGVAGAALAHTLGKVREYASFEPLEFHFLGKQTHLFSFLVDLNRYGILIAVCDEAHALEFF